MLLRRPCPVACYLMLLLESSNPGLLSVDHSLGKVNELERVHGPVAEVRFGPSGSIRAGGKTGTH
ncbi:MAG: hypothetical protein ACKOOI_15270, partial [Pirellula sp.]